MILESCESNIKIAEEHVSSENIHTFWYCWKYTVKLFPTNRRDSIIKGLNRYKGTWYKYFPNSFNFGIIGDREENVLSRALHLPEMSDLKNDIILCGTNSICIDSAYDIAQCLIDISVCFRNHSSKIEIFISRIFPRDECYSVNKMLINEINTILKFTALCIVLILLNKNKAEPIITTRLTLHCSIMTSCI